MTTGLARDATALMRSMSGFWAERAVQDRLLPQLGSPIGLRLPRLVSLRESLSCPYHCLQALIAHYGYSRPGVDRHSLQIGLQALQRTCEPPNCAEFFAEPDAARLWGNFCDISVELDRRPSAQLHQGILLGFAELAQEIYRGDGIGSISNWFVEGVLSSGRVAPQFDRLAGIRSVGPRLASEILRDLTLIHHIEDEVELGERAYLQPIDKWLRLLAPYVIPDLTVEGEELTDWQLATKIAKHARKIDISAIRFNLGCEYFGCHKVRIPEALYARLELAVR